VTRESDAIDPRNNPESRAAGESASQAVSRSCAGGAIFSGARPADSVPGPDLQDGDLESGTGAGHPLDGVLINPADAEQAVPGTRARSIPPALTAWSERCGSTGLLIPAR
jgi:hypothetical protein